VWLHFSCGDRILNCRGAIPDRLQAPSARKLKRRPVCVGALFGARPTAPPTVGLVCRNGSLRDRIERSFFDPVLVRNRGMECHAIGWLALRFVAAEHGLDLRRVDPVDPPQPVRPSGLPVARAGVRWCSLPAAKPRRAGGASRSRSNRSGQSGRRFGSRGAEHRARAGVVARCRSGEFVGTVGSRGGCSTPRP